MSRTRGALVGIATFALWLLSVVLLFVVIVILRDAIVLLYAWLASPPTNPGVQYGQRYWLGVGISNIAILVLAILGVVFVIGTGEYHYRHWGTRGSRRLFVWSFGIQLAVLALGWFI